MLLIYFIAKKLRGIFSFLNSQCIYLIYLTYIELLATQFHGRLIKNNILIYKGFFFSFLKFVEYLKEFFHQKSKCLRNKCAVLTYMNTYILQYSHIRKIQRQVISCILFYRLISNILNVIRNFVDPLIFLLIRSLLTIMKSSIFFLILKF